MMANKFAGWPEVGRLLNEASRAQQTLEQVVLGGGGTAARLNEGQRRSIEVIAENILQNGMVLADEVGMGKTRIAAELARCVIAAGGRVVVVTPPGLSFQWKEELRKCDVHVPAVIRTLDSFFAAWECKKPAPWFEQPIVMVSQLFTNQWRLGMDCGRRPWALFPALYIHWSSVGGGRRPKGYRDQSAKNSRLVRDAAESVCGALEVNGDLKAAAAKIFDGVRWSDAIDATSFGVGGALRPGIQKAVGLGLGAFDLIVIDEAHKNRRADGGLSVLLDNVLVDASEARVLGMTATPVELEMGQWLEILARVGVDKEALAIIGGADGKGGVLKDYAENLQRIRGVWRSSKAARDAFKDSAAGFKAALSRYLIRRDKREDPSVQRFKKLSGLHFNEYRDVRREVVVDPANLSLAWRKAICGAESISVSSPLAGDARARRLRLTMANGHGISALIAASAARKASVEEQAIDEHDDADDDCGDEEVENVENGFAAKRAARFQWWTDLIAQAVPAEGCALYDHPAILAAVHDIEKTNAAGEKVLVFGRFTAPLDALARLLNARELLRRVEAELHWPQSKVGERDIHAVNAARQQWVVEQGVPYPLDATALDELMKKRYESRQRELRGLRSGFIDMLRAGLPLVVTDPVIIARHLALLSAFEASTNANPDVLTMVHGALVDTLDSIEDAGVAQLATQAFLDLVEAAQDRDPDREQEEVADTPLQTEAAELWLVVEMRIQEEYGGQKGGLARLMNGETEQSTRRFLQQAFNRKNSFPQVLVAQSMVGREGLNLHKACRVVMLLHPEWNPGVVEQQIGRVDRVGSHWAQLLEPSTGRAPDDIPRIEVRPVIFKGTYDEHNWAVLRRRWDDLRAQLHGVVLPAKLGGEALSEADRAIYEEVMGMAPNFSPVPKAGVTDS